MPEKCSVIIDKLVEQRHNKGLTQKDLADMSGLPQSVIARFERKKNSPQLDTILKIAEALKCDITVVSRK